MKASDQEEALRRGRIDAGFLHPPISDNKLVFEKVMEERFVAVLPKTHRLARHKKIELRDLATDPFILFPRKHAPGCFDVIQNLCREAGFTPRTRHEAAEMTLCLNLIASGSGVTLAPACIRDWNVSGVVYRDLTGSGGTVESGFVRRAGELGTSLKQFLRLWQTDLAPRTPRRKT
jgi:DNA-binding transcriptional LysR family regulator